MNTVNSLIISHSCINQFMCVGKLVQISQVWHLLWQAYFRPELLNRLDEVVVFRQLDRHSIRHIADLVLADTALQLAKKNIKLEVAPAVMAKIVEGYDQVIQPLTLSEVLHVDFSFKSS